MEEGGAGGMWVKMGGSDNRSQNLAGNLHIQGPRFCGDKGLGSIIASSLIGPAGIGDLDIFLEVSVLGMSVGQLDSGLGKGG